MINKKKIINVDDEVFNNQNEVEFTPMRKQNRVSKKKNFYKYGAFLIVILVFVFGLSYSFFTYYSESSQSTSLSAAEIYVRVLENKVTLTLPGMYPMTETEARSMNDNYVDFTVVGKNTSETKYLFYNLLFQNGDAVAGRTTRIDPAYLKVDLEELVNSVYTRIVSATPLSELNFKGQVPPETNNQIERHFRLRVWVSDELLISDSEPNRAYTQAEFADLYASLSISVSSHDDILGVDKVRKAITAKVNATSNSCNPVWVDNMETANDTSDDITYFSGTNECVDMNYVWYSGKLWRITAIYPDGAMKLVTQNNITSIAYNSAEQVNFYTDASTTSWMYQWLNEDFYDTLYHASEFIDTTRLWNNTNSNASALSQVTDRLLETTMVSANVGLLNSYEFYNSYRCIGSAACTATYSSSYESGYLNIRYNWWLLNPYNATLIWRVNQNGAGGNNYTNAGVGVRPSIVIKSGLEFTGRGTSDYPYRIVGDKDIGNTNKLINTRLSGEYVKLVNNGSNQTFRIIGVEEGKTKIIAMDYADNGATKKFSTSTGTANTLWGSGTTIGTGTWYTYLNTSTTGYFAVLQSTYGDLFTDATYYFGTSGDNFKLSVCANTTSGNTKVCDKTSQVGTFNIGLPRYGEMFAAQQAGGYSNSADMWLMNRASNSYVYYANTYGSDSSSIPNSVYCARPTVHLKSTVKIISGSGTESDPYVVGL